MIGKNRNYITNLVNITHENVDQVGLKALQFNLIASEHIPITTGFVVNSKAFDDLIVANNLIDKITELIDSVDIQDLKSIKNVSKKIQEYILNAEIPTKVIQEIKEAYKGIASFSEAYVNISPSPINHNLDESKFEDILTVERDIKGEENILQAVKKIWASLFDENAIKYRETIHYSGELSIAILVQKAVQGEISGRAYNFDLTDNNPETIEIEAIYGSEDDEISGTIPADDYKVNKRNSELVEKSIVAQEWMILRSGKKHGDDSKQKISISPAWRKRQKVDNHTVENLARVVKKIEDILDKPFELKWAKEADRIFITEVNYIKEIEPLEDTIHIEINNSLQQDDQFENDPVVEEKKNKAEVKEYRQSHFDIPKQTPEEKQRLVLSGEGNNKGTVWGTARIINELDDLIEIDPKNILIISETLNLEAKDLTGLLFKGIVAEGNITGLDTPIINKAFRATGILRENEAVTVNSQTGNIYLGISTKTDIKNKSEILSEQLIIMPSQDPIKTSIDCFINIKPNLKVPKESVNIDGGFITDNILLKDFAKEISPKPIIFEMKVNKADLKKFLSQLHEIRDLRNKEDLRNIWITLSDITRGEDLIEAKKVLNAAKFRRSSSFKVLVTINNSAAILGIEEIVKNEIDGIVVDTEALLNEIFHSIKPELYKEAAFVTSLNLIIEKCISHKTRVYIKGDLPEEILIDIVKKGIYAIIIDPMKLAETKRIVADNELKHLTKKKKSK